MSGETERTPLDTWAQLLNDWYDRDRGLIEIGPGLLHDLTRDLQRAQMVLDASAATDALLSAALEDDESSPQIRIPYHRTAAGHPCRFSYCSTTRADGACPVCRAEDVMVTPIRVGDVVENLNDLSLDAREVTRIEGAMLWLRGPSGLDIGAFRVENYRPVGRAIADQRAAAVTR